MGEPLAIDSITASVVQGALENIAVEMGHKLMRMSYSSIIRISLWPISTAMFSSAPCTTLAVMLSIARGSPIDASRRRY